MTQRQLSEKAAVLKASGRDERHHLTITIAEAARRLGIGRNLAYECAKRGEIPTIRLGNRYVVPLAAFEAMLAVKSKQEIVASELVRRLRDEPEAA